MTYSESCIETYDLTPAEYEEHLEILAEAFAPPFELEDEISEVMEHDIEVELHAWACS